MPPRSSSQLDQSEEYSSDFLMGTGGCSPDVNALILNRWRIRSRPRASYDYPRIDGEAKAYCITSGAARKESRLGERIGRAAPDWETSISIDLASHPDPCEERGEGADH